MPTRKTCSAPDCARSPIARGLCASHYRQALRGGQPKPLRRPRGRAAEPDGSLVVIEVRVSPEAAQELATRAAAAGTSPAHTASLLLEAALARKGGTP